MEDERPQVEIDLELLAAVRRQLTITESKLPEYVKYARQSGATWRAIARALGVSEQAAWHRYARIEEKPLSDPIFSPLFSTPQDYDD